MQTKARVQHLQDQQRAVQQGITELTVGDNTSSLSTLTSTTPTSFDDQFSSRATVSMKLQI